MILRDTKKNNMKKSVSLLLNHTRETISPRTPTDQNYKGLQFISFPYKLQLKSCIKFDLYRKTELTTSGNQAETSTSQSNLESAAEVFAFFSVENGRNLSKSIFNCVS